MKITRIVVHQVTLPLIKPYRLSGGRLLFEELGSTIVGVETDAIQVMAATRAYGGYFEQPCETYEECLAARRRTTQPIILDESIQAYGDLVRGQNDGAMEAIGLKLGRVGGLTKARRMRDLCVATGIRMNIEDTGGGVIADTAAVHLAQSTPESHRRATWLCQDMIEADCAEGGARNEGGITRAPEAPGLGLRPRAEILGDPVAVYE
jgi:L-alanine-DL-glutamate epimerase-like enolase superfamily enzyme